MKYSIDVKKLKSMGFTYSNKNYKCYYKQYGSITLYCIVRGREVWVTNWGNYTKDVIDFVRSNYHRFIQLPSQQYMPLLINTNTGEIILETPEVRIDKYHNPSHYNNFWSLLIDKKDFDRFFDDIKIIV